jgi:predicted TIM-barrel fold metal-dependent hydrolase
MSAPLCLPPEPMGDRPTPAKRLLPVGTCDTHMHVIGASEIWPLAEERNYTPSPAPFRAYRDVMRLLGIERAVLVQPSVYGTDNRLLLQTLAKYPQSLRGIVVVPSDISDAALADLHRQGVRGVRINMSNPAGLGLDAMEALGRRIAPLGWHFLIQSRFPHPAGLLPAIRRSPVPVVLDHMGFLQPADSAAERGIFMLCELVAEGNTWVKLSAPYRLSQAPGFVDLKPWIASLVALRPDRLIWGSDWPHTEIFEDMPSDLDPALRLGLDSFSKDIQKRIYVKNPSKLYGFE